MYTLVLCNLNTKYTLLWSKNKSHPESSSCSSADLSSKVVRFALSVLHKGSDIVHHIIHTNDVVTSNGEPLESWGVSGERCFKQNV